MSATTRTRLGIWAACVLALAANGLRADQVQLQNGDHYSGKIISMTTNSIVLESDVLGNVTLPRNKVTSLEFGTATATTMTNTMASVANFTNAAPGARHAAIVSTTNTDVTTALRRMGANTNFIQQVRQQMLTGANPAASQKYDELVTGLMSGQLNVNDIKAQARKGIEQIQQLKRESGPEADASLDSYLTILQNFVNESDASSGSGIISSPSTQAPSANFSTNSAAPADN